MKRKRSSDEKNIKIKRFEIGSIQQCSVLSVEVFNLFIFESDKSFSTFLKFRYEWYTKNYL